VNIKSLEYFVEVANDLNITTASQRLYISQQALSAQIQKLERYYGVTLFERQPKLQLTYAGQQLLEGATRLLQENASITNSLSGISSKRAGILRIGIPAFRAGESLPLVLPEFTEKWPNVVIHLEDAPSYNMIEMVCDGTLDVCVAVPSPSEVQALSDRLVYTPLMEERTMLVCSDELLRRTCGPSFETLRRRASSGLDLRDFEALPFMLHKPPMRIRKEEDECFNSAGFKPRVFLETSKTELMISLYPCHVGAFFCRRTRIHTLMQTLDGCNAFPIRQLDASHRTTVYFVRRKSTHTPSHVTDFERMMRKAWKQLAEY
jgi:DNA-binding transcriptional LysR family regulator